MYIIYIKKKNHLWFCNLSLGCVLYAAPEDCWEWLMWRVLTYRVWLHLLQMLLTTQKLLAKQSCTSLLRSSGKPHLIIISLYGDELYMQRVLRVKVSTTYLSKAFPKSTFGTEDYSLKNKTKQKQKTMQAKSWIIIVAGHLWSTYYRPDIILINSFN